MAVILRSIAEEMHIAESRAQLVTLASSFEALAGRVESWQHVEKVKDEGAPGAPRADLRPGRHRWRPSDYRLKRNSSENFS